MQCGGARLRPDRADHGLSHRRDGRRAGQDDAHQTRGNRRGRRRCGRVSVLRAGRVRDGPGAGGRRRAQPLMELAKTHAEVRIAGGKLPPIALPTNCPGCGVGLDPEVLRKHAYVCECGHHFRLGADAWIALIADRGSWKERWGDVRSHDLLNWKVPKPYQATIDQLADDGLNEAVRTDPTFGGTAASLALLADINIAEPGAAIGFTGPRVIKQATYADLPAGFQSAEFQLARGQIDTVVARTELRRLLAQLLEMYP